MFNGKFYEEDTQKYKRDIEEQRRQMNRLNLLNETLSLGKCDEDIVDLKNKLTRNLVKMQSQIMLDKNKKTKSAYPRRTE